MRANRFFLQNAIAAGLVLSLSACGSSEESESEAVTSETADASAEPEVAVSEAPEAKSTAPADAPSAEPAEATAAKPTEKPKAVAIRGGKGSLEAKCQARVAKETGARVIGTNRIEESEAAIEIYVNVDGAEAPWRCLGWRDGTIAEVMYTGSEGAL